MELNSYQKQAVNNTEKLAEFDLLKGATDSISKIVQVVFDGMRKGDITEDNNRLMYTAKPSLEDRIEYDKTLKHYASEALHQFVSFCSIMGWQLDDVAKTSLTHKQ